MSKQEREEWRDISQRLQWHALRRFGRTLVTVRLNFHGGDRLTLAVDEVDLDRPAPKPDASAPADTGS